MSTKTYEETLAFTQSDDPLDSRPSTFSEPDEFRLDGWFVLLSNERTIWGAPDTMPEVAPSYVFELYRCEDQAEARVYLNGVLLRTGLTHIEDADILPVEQCGACGAGFDTRESHVALILQLYCDTPEGQLCPYFEYASRCCPQCISSGHPAHRRLLEEWTRLGATD